MQTVQERPTRAEPLHPKLEHVRALGRPWNVYFAGKINRDGMINPWRDDIADLPVRERGREAWETTNGIVKGGHNYTGPYLWTNKGHDPGYHYFDPYGPAWEEGHRQWLVTQCGRAIRRADFLFAWIEPEPPYEPDPYDRWKSDFDGHGTLVEIGMAAAFEKPAIVAFQYPETKNAVWFAAATAEHVIVAESALEAWKEALELLTPSLATMPYQQYLQTDHWEKTAAAAKERAGHKCQVCNSYGNLHTHHRTYERRGAELPDDLIVLCASCHSLFHKNGKLAR